MTKMDLLRRVSAPLVPERLVPVSVLEDPEEWARLQQQVSSLPSFADVRDAAAYMEQPLDRLYVDLDGLEPICYWDGVVHVGLVPNREPLDLMQIRDRIRAQSERIQEYLESGNYIRALNLVSDRARPAVFARWYPAVPEHQRYAFFRAFYVLQDRGLGLIDDALMRDALGRSPGPRVLPAPDADGRITIWRGEGLEARGIDRAYSWTTHYCTALFFAARFSLDLPPEERGAESGRPGGGSGARILRARVLSEQIIDYIQDRGEHEVLVLPETLEEIESTPLYDIVSLQRDMMRAGVWSDFLWLYKRLAHARRMESGSLFSDPDGIHGVQHARRVLLLALLLAHLESCTYRDAEVLAHAAAYHDIGRSGDGEDEVHGQASAEKASRLKLLSRLEPDDAALAKHLMALHCVPDDRAFDQIARLVPSEPERARRLLVILKDADGLDRVRLRDLDPRYLRTPSACRMPMVAWQALFGIQ